MENKKKYIIYGLLAVVGLGLTGYMSAVVVPQTFVTLTKAAPATQVSFADSYILADKIIALADGKDQTSVNVFVMDKSGKGVGDKSVSLAGMPGIEPEAAMTSNDGKASFKMKSSTEGQFKIKASVEGVEMARTVTVTFRN